VTAAAAGNGGRPPLAVVKFGGSFAFSEHLAKWIAAIAACGGRAVVVPGGGPFADAVRAAQARMGFGDAAAHRMGVLAMEQYGCALAALDVRLQPARSVADIRAGLRGGRVPVWLPARMVLGDAAIPQSWDVTSDSLAAWLAGRIGAARLVLVKHVTAAGELRAAEISVAELAARNVVDGGFAAFLAGSRVPAVVLGACDCAGLGSAVAGRAAGIAVVCEGVHG